VRLTRVMQGRYRDNNHTVDERARVMRCLNLKSIPYLLWNCVVYRTGVRVGACLYTEAREGRGRLQSELENTVMVFMRISCLELVELPHPWPFRRTTLMRTPLAASLA